jgi:hypothetical protein
MNNDLTNHSTITTYPIDYNTYPLASKAKFYKVELNENQFVFIPSQWFHWVYTEPYTISLSYGIRKINNDSKHIFQEKLKEGKPYKGKGYDISINYDSFIKKYNDSNFTSIISDTFDTVPVIKNNDNRFKITDKLSNIINNYSDKYIYIGMKEMYNDIFNEFNDINNFINTDYSIIKTDTSPYLWLSFDKKINSGLHYDDTPSILYVLKGKKTVYITNPEQKENLYLKTFPSLPNVPLS